MNNYSKQYKICILVYFIIFIAVSLCPYASFTPSGRISFFGTLYETNLSIPFLINTIYFLYYAHKSVWEHWKNK